MVRAPDVKDYGQRRRQDRTPVIAIGAILAVMVLGALVYTWSSARATRMANARAWTASGPACAATTPQALATLGYEVRQSQGFQGVTFARAHGVAICSTIGYDAGRSDDEFPVCQFGHPGGLVITTRKGVFAFAPGGVNGATVQVKHDVPSCVVGTSREVE
ncbi:MAG TPA: hypothetical protein VG248_06150 [Caulobacteraceae bacterium]|jgi:hypothetical protein|nr:hypothetical protein [Caulobacteraceae bacterium]